MAHAALELAGAVAGVPRSCMALARGGLSGPLLVAVAVGVQGVKAGEAGEAGVVGVVGSLLTVEEASDLKGVGGRRTAASAVNKTAEGPGSLSTFLSCGLDSFLIKNMSNFFCFSFRAFPSMRTRSVSDRLFTSNL